MAGAADTRLVLGFDIRRSPTDYVDRRWIAEWRQRFLLRPEVDWPLSVDTAVWPSVFHYGPRRDDPFFAIVEGPIDATPVNFHQQCFDLWTDPADMRRFLASQGPPWDRYGVEIAVVLHADAKGLAESVHKRFDGLPDERYPIAAVPPAWRRLGYDAADESLYSGLSNCGVRDDEADSLRRDWAWRLNKYGLFDSLDDARAFCKLTDRRVAEHKPFFAWEILANPAQMPPAAAAKAM